MIEPMAKDPMLLDARASTTMVCDQWPLSIQPGTGGHYGYLHSASSRNPLCFQSLLESLKDRPQSVVEHFGGVGIFSTIVQQMIHPSSHVVFDLDPDCVAQLQSAFGMVARVEMGDARYTMGSVGGELVVLDFPYATIKHHSEWPWGPMFNLNPRYVVWSDTAYRRLGLHRGLYSRLFQSPITDHGSYIEAYSRFIYERYGYSITHCAHHVYSYLLAQSVKPGVIQMKKITASMGYGR